MRSAHQRPAADCRCRPELRRRLARPQGWHFGAGHHYGLLPGQAARLYGDCGAILTDDADLVATLKSLGVHGQGTDKYDNVRIGVNSRLDTIQAAILMCKLDIFADEIEAR